MEESYFFPISLSSGTAKGTLVRVCVTVYVCVCLHVSVGLERSPCVCVFRFFVCFRAFMGGGGYVGTCDCVTCVSVHMGCVYLVCGGWPHLDLCVCPYPRAYLCVSLL